MKINLLLTIISFFQFFFSFSQAPEIEWQQSYGGLNGDNFAQFKQTLDGGFILAGTSYSGISGIKSEAGFGNGDFWIIKTDALGNLQWQNTLGGTTNDFLTCINITSDGGYIVGGNSNSPISGDKTEPGYGSFDFWVIKLNAAGNIEWQNTIGGSGYEGLFQLQQTTDGGYILGGSSSSGISVDKTETSFGFDDYWILKLNITGNIIWQKTLGGSNLDILTDIRQTNDNGFIIAGHSQSGASALKSENLIGVSDCWIIKLSEDGITEWENTIGGNLVDYVYSIKQTLDNGYIMGCSSESGISGDKNENSWNSDYWVVKLNAMGNIIWQNTINASGYDAIHEIIETSEGNFIAGGVSSSKLSADKTEDKIGFDDFWIVQLDTDGNLGWQNTIGGENPDVLSDILQLPDGGFLCGGSSQSGITGDKTTANYGTDDYWLLKLYPADCGIPSGIYTNNITTSKATIHWNEIATADQYQIWYRESGSLTWLKKSSILNIKTIKSLFPETNYEYKIRAKCNAVDFSEFSSIENFTTLPLKIGELADIKIVVYPNPTSNILFIELLDMMEDPVIEIYDIGGKEITNFKITENEGNISIDISNLQMGVYLIKVSGDGQFYSAKFTHQ